jgi:hypothetical protein
MTPENDRPASAENERLVAELEQALSMLNTALNDIDSATDVVVPPHRTK